MKKVSILLIILFAAAPILMAQKAGRKDNLQHSVYFSDPHVGLTLSKKEEMIRSLGAAYPAPIQLSVFRHDPKSCPQCGRPTNLSPKEQMKAEVTRLYTCPMHPDVPLDKNGKCPRCQPS